MPKVSPILLSDVYPLSDNSGEGRAFYHSDMGFGRVEAMVMPMRFGKVAIVEFEDLEASGAHMDVDRPDDPSLPIAARPETPGLADVTDSDNALRHIIEAMLFNPKVARHCMQVINDRIEADGQNMEAHLDTTRAQRTTPVYEYPSLHSHAPHGVYTDASQ